MKTSSLKEVPADRNLIAYCGIYCGSCGSYLKGKCPGCRESLKMSWCSVRKCCMENDYFACADCRISNARICGKYNTFISKIIGIVLNSDRAGCIERIKETGYDEFAREMSEKRIQTLRRK